MILTARQKLGKHSLYPLHSSPRPRARVTRR